MNQKEAKELIKNTLENKFNKDSYSKFVRNIFKAGLQVAEFSYHGQYIPEAYRDYIVKYERIGKFKDANSVELDIITVELKRSSSIAYARTAQRNFIRRYLSQKGRDAALVAFYTNGSSDWRFSFIKMEYSLESKKDEFTPAKRFSFLVGANEKSHTAQKQLVDLLISYDIPLVKDIENCFNIEKVTREFFQKYYELFIILSNELQNIINRDKVIKDDFDNHNINSDNFSKKLLGQIVFLYYIQKKGWLGVPEGKSWGEGNKNFIRFLFDKSIDEKKNFYNDYLEYLFYEALAVPNRDSTDLSYYPRFKCRIPFLNGGLFEPINNYDWVNTNITLNNSLFSNNKISPEGDKGTGILDVFDRYNFTVKEDEPLEKEVAVDPEMLGKVFENLLESKERKSKGAFYTPREIVHYMCQESIINYLHIFVGEHKSLSGKIDSTTGKTSLTVKEPLPTIGDIRLLIQRGSFIIQNENTTENKEKETNSYKFQLPLSIRENAQILDAALSNIKICDQAIGSGAFPMGMLTEIVKAREVLSIYFTCLEGEGKGECMRSAYLLKRHCIQESLYGVDIVPSAVDIAKLRLWLSLVVDEEDFFTIKPLPNLDYKIVCGNSLVGLPTNFTPSKMTKVEEMKKTYFEETNHNKKEAIKDEIYKALQPTFDNSEKHYGYKIDFDFRLNFSEVFSEKSGFDIVIGNPPYIQLQKDGGRLSKLYSLMKYETLANTGDIYALFYEKGFKILKEGGILTFITSNKWMRAGYGEKLRKFFAEKTLPLLLIDLGPGIFESATVDTNILMIKKVEQTSLPVHKYPFYACTIKSDFSKNSDIASYFDANKIAMPKLTKDAWTISGDIEMKIKEKIERIGTPLKDWDINIYRGIVTGFNEAFIIDGKKKDELIAQDPKSAEIIKPILRGRDIKRYKAEFADLYLLFIPWHFPLHKDPNISGNSEKAEKAFQKEYPAIYNHLLNYKNQLSKRNKEETGIRYEWYALQRCANTYYEEFEKEKIVWAETDQNLNLARVGKGIYLQKTCFMILGKSIIFLNAVLNSSLIQYIIRRIAPNLGEKGMSLTKEAVRLIPIPKISHEEQQPFIDLVNKILTKKENNEDTTAEEQEIDKLAYKLYELTYDEVKIVDPAFSMSQEEYNNFTSEA